MYPNLLMKRASLTPNRVALRFNDQEWTFAQLLGKATKYAEKLHTKGITRGMRVAILASSDVRLVVVLHGCMQIGCELVMLNERLSEEELNYQLADSAPDLLLVDDHAKRTLSFANKWSFDDVEGAEQTAFEVEKEWPKERTITIMYTSGTTGRPKGVRQSLENHLMNATGSALNLGVQPNDCWLCTMPLFHISGFSILMRSVIYGMTVSLHTKFDALAAVEEILSGTVTRMSVVAVTLERMLTVLEERELSFPDTFRSMLVGGGPVPLHYLERAIERNIPVLQTYGMTETASQTTTLASEDAIIKLGSAGKPLFFANVRIDGVEKIGEICIKGPHVTQGYVGAAEQKNPLVDGWLHTGDLGYLDEEGYLFVVDRRSDLIISGGENIYPAEIEQALAKHPAVKEAGVAGRQDDKWGQVPVAFVVLKEETTEESLRAFMKKQLASYKQPVDYYFVDQLPRNASNKLLRREFFNHIKNT
ncbi:o-succinylbenzoate--CoA ligase [Psychrobacillus lasiicapitis]|uniref:2-succinylbenzoate--CoA ligase n=1 Tax=Psychrobacillus lasiicapitis TaxID=1636719 RepID=A0A544T9K8_9BACI|nr:o-succinylbenzoate--CoA ligase [Psychrobacillus lasiicapitis]TQR14038.1 o-succinylbenzoate--CoA ligase [Psychrobacillus lasiicapitis]GGA37653.1 2-succinylbenzoate--CoA ligase [Psychrobacillus lasiicapitis]